MLSILFAACGGSVAATQPAVSAGSTTQPKPVDVPLDCSNDSPCNLAAGTYSTGTGAHSFVPGMTLTVPRGWSSHSLIWLEFSLIPPGHPDDRVFFWEDMLAVKSSGPGHGTTILPNVGKSPKAIISWLTHNPDFLVVSPPTAVTGVDGIKATRVVLGISHRARYGDSACPYNPRCADLFARPDNLSEYFSIGGRNEVRIDIATIKVGGTTHTLFVVLSADTHAQLEGLTPLAQPIINSVRLPAGATSG